MNPVEIKDERNISAIVILLLRQTERELSLKKNKREIGLKIKSKTYYYHF